MHDINDKAERILTNRVWMFLNVLVKAGKYYLTAEL